MLKIILPDRKLIAPFNERARELRIWNKPLWLNQRDALAPFVTQEMELAADQELPAIRQECLVFRDNLLFDQEYIDEFLKEARKRSGASRAAFSTKEAAFRVQALPLSRSYERSGDLYLADLWYYPNGPTTQVEPLIVDLLTRELGYYRIPAFMAGDLGQLGFQVPLRSLHAIDSWVHLFVADIVFGLFKRGARFEHRLERDPAQKLAILGRALYQGKQVLQSAALVRIGRNCSIDPSAVIHGPTSIGDNVSIGAGTVIDNCTIGDNVNISQGCQLMLSVVGDGSFLPFRAALFMTTLMDNSIVAQNTCLQLSVVGRNTFIGAGSTFTDFNLMPGSLRAMDGQGELRPAGREVLGGCVGHNCRIGSGLIIFPARTIESDVVLISSAERRVISENIHYAQSDHHRLAQAAEHIRQYPPTGQELPETW